MDILNFWIASCFLKQNLGISKLMGSNHRHAIAKLLFKAASALQRMNFLHTSAVSFVLIFAVCAATLFSAAFIRAEVIPTSRMTNWQGTVGVEGGIPRRTTIYKTLGPGATALQINAAIAACPSGQVVKLKQGTYNLTAPIYLKSNVTLRGTGGPHSRTKTILKFAGIGGYAYIHIKGTGDFKPSLITNWTAGYSPGTTAITVANAIGFRVGQLVCLDQLNDPAYIGYGASCAACGATITGQNINRLQHEIHEITAISGTTITISPGVYMPNFAPGFAPNIWRSSLIKKEFAGIEDLKVDGTSGTAHSNISIEYAQNCWVKNVESMQGNLQNIQLFADKNIEIRQSWIHDSKGSGVGKYGIQSWMVTGALFEDNTLNDISSLIVINDTQGSVIGYNYIVNSTWNTPGWLPQAIAANHNAHPAFNLFEGNISPGFYSDYIHGSSSYTTIFRNRFVGKEKEDQTNNTHAITLEEHNRYFNIVGNILGETGYHDHYERSGHLGGNFWWEGAIYKLGYRSTYESANDSLVASTLLRHGNYDTYTDSRDGSGNGIVWDSSITDHTLPDSLYLGQKPIWFGNLTWPPVDPASPASVTAASLPAGVRFMKSANQLRNISSRGFVQGGSGVLIGGFIITGTGQKKVALRGIGPSLALSPALSNPMIELRSAGGALLAQNDDWKTSQAAEISAAGLAPRNDKEAVLITTLNPGSYTAIVRGVSNATGIGLVEIYDLDATGGWARLGNISTRGNVLSGNGVLIGGFIAGGGDWSPLVVARAIGPSLANHGISNVLADPMLELHNANGALITSNDNWRDGNASDITGAGLGPSNPREAAVSARLAPGSYTVVISGKNGASGVALAEIYSIW